MSPKLLAVNCETYHGIQELDHDIPGGEFLGAGDISKQIKSPIFHLLSHGLWMVATSRLNSTTGLNRLKPNTGHHPLAHSQSVQPLTIHHQQPVNSSGSAFFRLRQVLSLQVKRGLSKGNWFTARP